MNFHTFALGLRVDFSEDSEPTEEVGDSPGPEDAVTPLAESEPVDVELTVLPWISEEFVSPLPFPDDEPSIKSPGKPVFEGDFDEI